MRALFALLAALVLSAVALAGCLDGPGASDLSETPEATSAAFPFDYENATWPTGAGAHAFIADYIMNHPYRSTTNAFRETFMVPARNALAAELEGMGLEVVRHAYSDVGVNILGVKHGTLHPEQWVVLSAHYDTADTTIYGAWDDGAGVAVLLEVAQATRDWEFPFTVVFAFFDEEEKGLVGSRNFVRHYLEDQDVELVANINTDPPGLNWPCGDAAGDFPVKIIHDMGKVADPQLPRFAWLHDAMEHGLDATGVPMGVRDYSPGIPIAVAGGVGLRGTSDHANFNAVDIANVYLGGTPTTTVGPVSALTYLLHTPLDTLAQMEARCTGGGGDLKDGLNTSVLVIAHTLVAMARNPVPPPTAGA